MKEFYVYQYIDEDPTPYYIGKGKANRIREKHLYTVIPPVERRIIVESNLTEEQAFILENKLIREYGRKIDGGSLDNIKVNRWACTSGWKQSTEAKQKISIGNTGKIRSAEAIQNYSKPKTKEHAEKIRRANLGRKDDGRYAKASATLKGKPWSEARRLAQENKNKGI